MEAKKSQMGEKKVAVILCGSGYRDGSEIRESVGVLWALSQTGVSVQCFAPDSNQADVINCLTGEAMKENRNMLVEAARIARGKVLPLAELERDCASGAGSTHDAIILPGGFGAAKNLCTFATRGSSGTVRSDLQSILVNMNRQGKPIGAVCIAPAILALAFKGLKKLELTVGMKSETSSEIEKLGHRHFECRASEAHFDAANKVASTPAYMEDSAALHDIFEGIRKTVQMVVDAIPNR